MPEAENIDKPVSNAVDLRNFFTEGDSPVSTSEFMEFYKSLTLEQRVEYGAQAIAD